MLQKKGDQKLFSANAIILFLLRNHIPDLMFNHRNITKMSRDYHNMYHLELNIPSSAISGGYVRALIP